MPNGKLKRHSGGEFLMPADGRKQFKAVLDDQEIPMKVLEAYALVGTVLRGDHLVARIGFAPLVAILSTV